MTIAPQSSWGQALVVTSAVFLALSWITVGARVWVRQWIKSMGFDDYLMCLGLAMYTVTVQNHLSAVYNGVGTADVDLDAYYQMEGRKWFLIAQVTYCATVVPIKCSICIALLRFAVGKRYRYPLFGVIALTITASLITIIVLLAFCRPISANWDPSSGTCGDPSVIVSVSYFISAVSIITDWACAILPALILWSVQLKSRVKVSLIIVLSLGAFASSAVIVRFSFLVAYQSTENYLFGLPKIAIWGPIECGVGIIAGSLASLRPLLKSIPFLSQDTSKKGSTAGYGASHGLQPLSRGATNLTGNRKERERHGDADSQKCIIKETTVVMYEDREQHAQDEDIWPLTTK